MRNLVNLGAFEPWWHKKELYSSLPPILDYGNIINITFDGKPPSQPSPRGEGARELPA